MINLWNFDVAVVTYKTTQLVRLKHRFDPSYFGGRNFRDLDTKNSLGDPGAFNRTTKFIREELGFSFPLPVGPKTAQKIFSGANYPSIEQWESFCGEGYYSRDDYHSDLRIFHAIRALPRTHDVHFQNLKRTYQIICKISSVQNQAAYCHSLLREHFITLEKLDKALGYAQVPADIVALLKRVGQMGKAYIPEHKPSSKKMLQASDTQETTIKKKARKKTVIANQQTIC